MMGKKIPTHICSRKADQSLSKRDTFILTDYGHNIIFDDTIRRDIIEYDKQLPEYY